MQRLSKNNRRMNIRKIAFFLIGFVFFIKPALGKTAFDMATAGIGARPMGMGRAYVAVSDDPNVMFMNPAGIGLQKSWGITSMSSKLMDNVDYRMIGGVYATSVGTVGIGYLSSTTPAGYLTTDIDSINGAQPITYGSTMLMLSYGRDMSEFLNNTDSLGKLSFGFNLKSVSSQFQGTDGSSNGTSVDAGLLFKANKNMSFGISVQNLSGGVAWNDGVKEDMPRTTKLGGAYNFDKGMAALDVEFGAADMPLFHGGVEYRAIDALTLRAGIDQTATAKDQTALNYTMGVGLKVSNCSFDYAYRADSSVSENSTSYFSISFQPSILDSKKMVESKSTESGASVSNPAQKQYLDGVYHSDKLQQSQRDILSYYN